VSGLEQKFPGKVTAVNIDASTPEARAAVKELGFEHHGLVVKSADGRILLKQADHAVQPEAVELALHELWDT
jgi:hypothetical protein